MNFTVFTQNDYQSIVSKLDCILHAINHTKKKEDRLLEVKEAAKELRVSEKTLRSYIETNFLSAINLNKGTPLRPIYKILQSDLDKFIKSKKV